MKNRIYPLLSASMMIMLIVAAASCKKVVTEGHREEARELYESSVKLISRFTDSVLNAKDSNLILSADKRFEHDLTALNFKYPNETCLEISEGENDTLTSMTERYVHIRDSVLFRLSHPIEQKDSLSNESEQSTQS